MVRKISFSVPTLLAAGLAPMVVQADAGHRVPEQDNLEPNSLKSLVSNLDETHSFTLAAHQSHQSHSSHGSHSSHRSYSYRLTPDDGAPTVIPAAISSRNEMSTPANSVLPSSPAIVRKLKILPGNSRRFRELVTQVQIALLAKGYEVGVPNGEIHARTVAALYQYQNDIGLVPSGKITKEVFSSLGIVAQ